MGMIVKASMQDTEFVGMLSQIKKLFLNNIAENNSNNTKFRWGNNKRMRKKQEQS